MRKKFTVDVIIEMSKTYKTRKELRKASATAYGVARELGLLVHFGRTRKARISKEAVIDFVQLRPEIKFRSDLLNADRSMYRAAINLGILEELFPVKKKRLIKASA